MLTTCDRCAKVRVVEINIRVDIQFWSIWYYIIVRSSIALEENG